MKSLKKSDSYERAIFISEFEIQIIFTFHFKNKLSAIPKLSSERFVQIDEGPFAFPEFSLRKNALLRPRPRPTASTLADRIRT